MGCNNCGLIRSTATKRLEGHCLGKSLSQHTSVGERCSETYQTTSLARQMGFVASRCRFTCFQGSNATLLRAFRIRDGPIARSLQSICCENERRYLSVHVGTDRVY